jgi:hypothetical protein
MTIGEHLSEVVTEAVQAGVSPQEIIFTLDMLSHELKSRLLADATKRPGLIIPKPEIIAGGQG